MTPAGLYKGYTYAYLDRASIDIIDSSAAFPAGIYLSIFVDQAYSSPTPGGSGVTSVTASAPLSSSGGSTPNISFALPVIGDWTIQTSSTVGPNLILNAAGGGYDWRIKSSGAADPAGVGVFAIQSFSDGTTPFVITPVVNNVGIGLTGPTARLHVRRGVGAGGDVSDGNALIKYESDTNATNFWFNVKDAGSGGTNATIGFATAGTIRSALTYNVTGNYTALTNAGASGAPTSGLIVSSSGKVGVGVIDPFTAFHVKDGADQNLGLSGAIGAPSGLSSGIAIASFNDARSFNLPMQIRATDLVLTAIDSGTTRFTRSPLGILTEDARFDSAGNFGLGTTSPFYKLDVVGSARFNGNFAIGNATPAPQQVGGAATAGALYTAVEQSMLQTLWDASRTFGFLS